MNLFVRDLQEKSKMINFHKFAPATPGPSMDIRPKSEQCIAWAEEAGFINPKQHDLNHIITES